ncbi:MAG: hypothetical protein IIB71_02050 [Proteobacteria bacterium]|nr:hypothetical protein [Pseudomonadota bacterium]
MLTAALVILVLIGLVLSLFFAYVNVIPKNVLRFIAYFFLVISTIETVFIVWVVGYALSSDWTLWSLSFNDFWKEQLSAIYFIKEWFYTWFWNDFLDLLFVFLPAVVFLGIRTTFTTVLGFWALAVSRKQRV